MKLRDKILNYIKQQGPSSAPEISKGLGLPHQRPVHQTCRHMASARLLMRHVGQKPVKYSIAGSAVAAPPSAAVPASTKAKAQAGQPPAPQCGAKRSTGDSSPNANITIILQCQKRKMEATFTFQGRPVRFVAQPALTANINNAPYLYVRPDDCVPDSNITWRDVLAGYNINLQANLPNGIGLLNGQPLKMAWDLYKNPAYQAVVRNIGVHNFYILSAGWGLVRSDFRLPNYDITFTRDPNAPSTYRKLNAPGWHDFNAIQNMRLNNLHAAMGRNYAAHLMTLMGHTPLTLHHWADEELGRWHLVRHTKMLGGGRMNWMYDCAQNLSSGCRC